MTVSWRYTSCFVARGEHRFESCLDYDKCVSIWLVWKMCCKVRQEFAKLSFRNGLIGSIPISSANAHMAERSNATVCKTVKSLVQIQLCAPKFYTRFVYRLGRCPFKAERRVRFSYRVPRFVHITVIMLDCLSEQRSSILLRTAKIYSGKPEQGAWA